MFNMFIGLVAARLRIEHAYYKVCISVYRCLGDKLGSMYS